MWCLFTSYIGCHGSIDARLLLPLSGSYHLIWSKWCSIFYPLSSGEVDGRGLLWFLQLPGSSNSLHRFEGSRQLGSANLLLVTGPEGTCSGSVMCVKSRSVHWFQSTILQVSDGKCQVIDTCHGFCWCLCSLHRQWCITLWWLDKPLRPWALDIS